MARLTPVYFYLVLAVLLGGTLYPAFERVAANVAAVSRAVEVRK